MSGKELAGKDGLEIEILNEIKSLQTDYGPKPTGKVKFSNGLETKTKDMRFNQTFINHLIKTTKSKNSKDWIGWKGPITAKLVKGNMSIVPKIE